MSTDNMAEFTKMPASDDAFYEQVLDLTFCTLNLRNFKFTAF